MKNAVRALALGIFAIGASAAISTSHFRTVTMVASHQAVSAVPIPTCGPSGCTAQGGGH